MKEDIKEIFAFIVIIIIIIGMPAAIIYYEGIIKSRYGKDTRIIDISAMAPKKGCLWTLEGIGGYNYWWKDFEQASEIPAKLGERIIFRVRSSDVLHSFAIPQFRIGPYEIEAGKVKEVEFIPERAGSFKYLCWLWCSDCHPDLTGKIVVEEVEVNFEI